MSARAIAIACALLGLQPRMAAAEAVFEIVIADPAGVGFGDMTAVAPVGGNSGSTLGEQRRIALQHAADLWGQALDSSVPIVIEARFDALGCMDGAGTLAYAGTATLESGIDAEGANPNYIYPAALADRLMGEDLLPDEPDIQAVFNIDVDDACLGPGTSWYYGLDARHGNDADFVNVALHELAHGLGVHDLTDHSTGQLIGGRPSAFSAHVFDRQTGKHWHEMTAAERVASLTNARNVVWDGPRTIAAAPALLSAGSPRVNTTPAIAQFSGLAGDATYGAPSLSMSISAELVSQADGCPMNNVSGRIALLRDECANSVWVAELEAAGALGALLAAPFNWDAPPPSFEEPGPEPVQIPVLSVSVADAERLRAADEAGSVTVHLSHDAGTLRGSDDRGRVFLNATVPASSSSIAHWDSLTRPNLLMEPFETEHSRHALDLTPAMLSDIGWTAFCGNGRQDGDEACDEGDDNSDEDPDVCRTDCSLPSCGDGVADDGEDCDDGDDNSDEQPDACRTDCSDARCGDGVRDDGEACDEGEDNSDSQADACRSDCRAANCGDGVSDRGEECDTGAARSATAINACRLDCLDAHCGDGVVDFGEQCDEGDDNDDQQPGSCREDCQPARCGDMVVDSGEGCDDGARNSDSVADACRSNCRPARCGDRVKDSGEACDSADIACAPDCSQVNPIPGGGAVAGTSGGVAGQGPGGAAGTGAAAGEGAGPEPDAVGEEGGCGCRAAGAERSSSSRAWLLLAPALLLGLRRRSRSV